MRTFVFNDARSNKFWHIALSGKKFTVQFGRVGTSGQRQTKSFVSADLAEREHDKLIRQKLGKGYVETTPAPAAAPATPERMALEAGLAAHPDELAAHSAYADFLTEEGDPRGEFIQVQLALEDPARTKAERTALKKRETALLQRHAGEWMGDVGRFLAGPWSGPNKPCNYRFARGWLDYARVSSFPDAILSALTRAPEARLLRHLEVVYDMRFHPFEYDPFYRWALDHLRKGEARDPGAQPYDALRYLAEPPGLTNLRTLKFGFSDDHPRGPSHTTMWDPFEHATVALLLDVLAKTPRLEELYLNTNLSRIDTLFRSPALAPLRVFQYYYGVGTYGATGRAAAATYPLGALARNKALSNITTLRFHPGRDGRVELDEFAALLRSKNLPNLRHLQIHGTTFGDEGAERIVGSGILKRLKTLDIAYGDLTDAGAAALAACPDLKNLEVLDVSLNSLSEVGVEELEDTGVRVVADGQHGEGETDYLSEVDWE
jgi:uncharacterized protein (TIGR02996 family)